MTSVNSNPLKMEHKLKELVEALTNQHTKDLIETHARELRFENNHLTIYLDNAAPLHELEEEDNDKHLRDGLEKVFGEDITYEVKLVHGHEPSDKEKCMGRRIQY
jgi:hypothetical protein